MDLKEPLIKANRVLKYSITYQEITEESREYGEISDSGFIIENETDEIGNLLKLAVETYGIYYPVAFGWWESTNPVQNKDYFEKGIEIYYILHITNEDGTDITEKESDFITFLLSDGNYNKDEFTEYAIGGIVAGAIALGIGGLIAYYYFNKGKKGYPTGRAWTKEHYNDNDDEDYEISPNERNIKHKARNRQFDNGGEIKVGDTIYRAWFTDDDGEKSSVIIITNSLEEAEKKADLIDNGYGHFSYVSNPIKIKNKAQLFEEIRENEPIYKFNYGGGVATQKARVIDYYINNADNEDLITLIGVRDFPNLIGVAEKWVNNRDTYYDKIFNAIDGIHNRTWGENKFVELGLEKFDNGGEFLNNNTKHKYDYILWSFGNENEEDDYFRFFLNDDDFGISKKQILSKYPKNKKLKDWIQDIEKENKNGIGGEFYLTDIDFNIDVKKFDNGGNVSQTQLDAYRFVDEIVEIHKDKNKVKQVILDRVNSAYGRTSNQFVDEMWDRYNMIFYKEDYPHLFTDGGEADDYFTMKDGSKMNKNEWYQKMEEKMGFEKFAESELKDAQFGRDINAPLNELTHNRLDKKAVIGKNSVTISSYTPNYKRHLDSITFYSVKELNDYLNKNQILADGGMAGLGEVSGMLPNALPMSTITPMANGGYIPKGVVKTSELKFSGGRSQGYKDVFYILYDKWLELTNKGFTETEKTKNAKDWAVAYQSNDGTHWGANRSPYDTRYLYSPSLDLLREQTEGEWYGYGSVSDTFADGGGVGGNEMWDKDSSNRDNYFDNNDERNYEEEDEELPFATLKYEKKGIYTDVILYDDEDGEEYTYSRFSLYKSQQEFEKGLKYMREMGRELEKFYKIEGDNTYEYAILYPYYPSKSEDFGGKYANGGKTEEVYIEFLNKEKGYKEDVKHFNSYEEAVEWARKNFDKFDSDMIKYKYADGGGVGEDLIIDEYGWVNFSKGDTLTIKGTDVPVVGVKLTLDELFAWQRGKATAEIVEKSKDRKNIPSGTKVKVNLAISTSNYGFFIYATTEDGYIIQENKWNFIENSLTPKGLWNIEKITIKSGNNGNIKVVYHAIKNQRNELNAIQVFEQEKSKGKSVFLFVNNELYDEFIADGDEEEYADGGGVGDKSGVIKFTYNQENFEIKYPNGEEWSNNMMVLFTIGSNGNLGITKFFPPNRSKSLKTSIHNAIELSNTELTKEVLKEIKELNNEFKSLKNEYADGGGVDTYFEIVVVAKGLEKDGGQIIKDRYNINSVSENEAKNIAEEMWKEDMGNSDFHIIEILTDTEYRNKYLSKKYDNGGGIENAEMPTRERTTITRPTTEPTTTPSKPDKKNPYKPKHIPKPKARK